MALNILSFIFVLFFGCVADLYIRVNYLDGSLDDSWTIPLSMCIPCQVVPAIYHLFGWIKKGGGGNPIDVYMMVPMIGFFVSYFASEYAVKKGMNGTLIMFGKLFITISIGTAAFYMRASNVCAKLQQEKANQQAKKHTKKTGTTVEAKDASSDVSYTGQMIAALESAVIAHGFAAAISLALDWIPPLEFLKLAAEAFFPAVGSFTMSILYPIGYVMSNMFSGYKMYAYCHGSPLGYFASAQKNMLLMIAFMTICAQQYTEYIMDFVNMAETAVLHEGEHDAMYMGHELKEDTAGAWHEGEHWAHAYGEYLAKDPSKMFYDAETDPWAHMLGYTDEDNKRREEKAEWKHEEKMAHEQAQAPRPPPRGPPQYSPQMSMNSATSPMPPQYSPQMSMNYATSPMPPQYGPRAQQMQQFRGAQPVYTPLQQRQMNAQAKLQARQQVRQGMGQAIQQLQQPPGGPPPQMRQPY